VSASAAYKLKLAKDSVKRKCPTSVTIRSVGSYPIEGIRDVKHSIIITLANNGGFVTFAPEDLVSVWVQELPDAFKESRLHAD
jgi:hypothetical protein